VVDSRVLHVGRRGPRSLQQGCSKRRRRKQVDRVAQVLNDEMAVGACRRLDVAMAQQALHAVRIDALAQEQRSRAVAQVVEAHRAHFRGGPKLHPAARARSSTRLRQLASSVGGQAAVLRGDLGYGTADGWTTVWALTAEGFEIGSQLLNLKLARTAE